MGQWNWLIEKKKKKLDLREAPQLINMKQQKYPPEYSVIVISGTYYIHVELCYVA